MLKKTITYTDFNDNRVSDEFYFNLTRTELTEWEMQQPGGMSKFLERVIAAGDVQTLVKEFKDLVLRSYGEKSEDGRYFRKSAEITHDFSCMAAFDELYMQLAQDSEKAAEFVNAVIPKELVEAATKDAQAMINEAVEKAKNPSITPDSILPPPPGIS